MSDYEKFISEVKTKEERTALEKMFTMMQFLKAQMLFRIRLGSKNNHTKE